MYARFQCPALVICTCLCKILYFRRDTVKGEQLPDHWKKGFRGMQFLCGVSWQRPTQLVDAWRITLCNNNLSGRSSFEQVRDVSCRDQSMDAMVIGGKNDPGNIFG